MKTSALEICPDLQETIQTFLQKTQKNSHTRHNNLGVPKVSHVGIVPTTLGLVSGGGVTGYTTTYI